MPVTQVEPPPVAAALWLSFQVSLPGSPLVGIVWVRQTSFWVERSVAAIQPRMPYSAPATPVIAMFFTIKGAPVIDSPLSGSATVRCQVICPVCLLVAISRPSSVCEMIWSPHSATPRLSTPQQAMAPAQSRSVFGSIFQTSTLPAVRVDLVDRAPAIGDVEKPVLGNRRALQAAMRPDPAALDAAEMQGPGDLKVLDVVAVDRLQRRERCAA